MKDTKTIQMLASVSLLGGPLSLIIGGVMLSIAALVCGIVALVIIRRSKDPANDFPSEAIRQTLVRQATVGIAMSVIALIMNVANIVMMMPAIMDAVQTGDYSSLLGGGAPATDSAATNDSGGAFGGGSGDTTSNTPQSGRSSVWG